MLYLLLAECNGAVFGVHCIYDCKRFNVVAHIAMILYGILGNASKYKKNFAKKQRKSSKNRKIQAVRLG